MLPHARTLLLIALSAMLLPSYAHAQEGDGSTGNDATPLQRPTLLQPAENGLLWQGLPAPPALQAVSRATADQFWRTLQAEQIEHRYIVGSCEDRAQYVSLMLRRAGIASGKIWVIAPSRYTLLSRELISVQDPYGVTPSVTWGHHVAPIIEVLHESRVDTLVIDQSFSPGGFLTLDQWFERLNSPRSIYFVTGVNDYLFKSANGLIVYGNNTGLNPIPTDTLPTWFPNVLTGDFQPYNYSSNGAWITGGMATNDVAMQIFEGSLPRVATPAERQILGTALRSEKGMDALVGTELVSGLTPATLSALRSYFQARVRHWDTRLQALNRVQG